MNIHEHIHVHACAVNKLYDCFLCVVELLQLEKAVEHLKEVSNKIQCDAPQPRCFDVSRLFTTPNEQFVPRCTIQHQCTNTTGCCDVTSHCAPQHKQNVTRLVIVSY